jgi:hypothetical protein
MRRGARVEEVQRWYRIEWTLACEKVAASTTTTTTKYCGHCGVKLSGTNLKICGACGKKLWPDLSDSTLLVNMSFDICECVYYY